VGVWGLGLGGLALGLGHTPKSPIPNPHCIFPIPSLYYKFNKKNKNSYNKNQKRNKIIKK